MVGRKSESRSQRAGAQQNPQSKSGLGSDAEAEQRRMLIEQIPAQRILLDFLVQSSVGFAIAGRAGYRASGTLIEWRGWKFIATAAHVLQDLASSSALSLDKPGERTRFEAEVQFDPTPGLRGLRQTIALREIASACLFDSTDIAVVLLRADASLRLPGMLPVPERSIGGTPGPLTNIQVIGFPFDISDIAPGTDRVLFSTHIKYDCAKSVHSRDKPGAGSRSGLATDYHLDWSCFVTDPAGAYQSGLSPEGLSGGGAWMCEAGHKWTERTPSECALLFGIPWLWQPKATCFRAIAAGQLRLFLSKVSSDLET